MSTDFYKQIYSNLDLKETDELLGIWKTNDHTEWADEAFQAIKEILKNRKVDAPEQDEPIYEHDQNEEEIDKNDFSEDELKIIDDENPPDFYDPLEVLKLTKWIDLASTIIIILYIILNLMNFQTDKNITSSFFIGYPQSSGTILIYISAIVLMVINTAIEIAIVYFPLRALARILKILMEMEFKSRSAQ